METRINTMKCMQNGLAVLLQAWMAWAGLAGGLAQAADSTPTADFTDNGDGTVFHKITGLTWMRCALGQTWTGSTCTGTGTANEYTFNQAIAISHSFAGKSDWRTPSIDELKSIIDLSASRPPMINQTIFPNTPSSYFWSGSPYAYSRYLAWGVHFHGGYASSYGRGYGGHVRLVRGGQSSAPLPSATTPTALSIGSAASSLAANASLSLTASATYSDSSSKTVTPTWTSSNTAVAAVSSSGVVTAGKVSSDTSVTLSASYSEGGTTVTASKTVTVLQETATAAQACATAEDTSGGFSAITIAGARDKRTGENLEVGYCAAGFDPKVPVDLYVAVFIDKDQTFLFLQCSGDIFCSPAFYPDAKPYYTFSRPEQKRDVAGNVLTVEHLPADLAAGLYTFYAVVVKQGADVMQFTNWIGELRFRQMRFTP
jgi:hypothetical protein